MGEWLQEYIDQLKELWSQLNKRAKIIITASTIGILVALGILIFWSGGTTYQPLFSELTEEDASAVVDRLDEEGIDYKLKEGGSTIEVPADQVHKTRLDMAGEGLPDQGTDGYEIFDESQFGTTDFERRVNFYRALGGELSRSIKAMEAVDFARVQISAPEESLYTEEERPAEASVLVKLKPGHEMKEGRVKAIRNLVASGVQGLDGENVTIVDTAGNLLTAGLDEGDMSSGQNSQDRMEIEKQFEERLRADLRALLTKVVGPDDFSVQVRADLNFDEREVEEKDYSPVTDDEGIVRSQEEITEEEEGYTGDPEGAPGTDTNLEQDGAPEYEEEEGATGSNYERSETVTNYEINERLERQVYAPGEVENLSVAVMLDNDMDEETTQQIQESIEAAIGYDEERDDSVSVTSLEFDDSMAEEAREAQAAQAAAERREMYIYGGLIALILILLLTSLIILRRSQAEKEITPGQAMDMMVGEESEEELAATELSEEEKKRKEMKEDIEELINDRPEEVAQILKSWLLEE